MLFTDKFWMKQVISWTSHQSTAGQVFMLTANLESPVDLTSLSLNCGTEPEYPETTHTDTGRACKCHTEWPWLAGKFELGDSTNHCIIVPTSTRNTTLTIL